MGGNWYLIKRWFCTAEQSWTLSYIKSEFFSRYCFDLPLSKSGEDLLYSLENKLRASVLQGTPCVRKGNIWSR